MRQRDSELNSYWGTICTPLEILAPDGKIRETNCANTEGVFRIIQSIPSPKTEPFKRRLAKVRYERVQEIEDPELANRRTRKIYKAKGYSDAWIEKRDVKEEPEYATLASQISKAAFGLTPGENKKLKGLERENLRDRMTDLGMIFSSWAKPPTRRSPGRRMRGGVAENKTTARKGGRISGKAREKLEAETGESVVTPENYLIEPESRKRVSLKKKRIEKRQRATLQDNVPHNIRDMQRMACAIEYVLENIQVRRTF